MDDRTVSHAGTDDAPVRGLDGIARHDWTRADIAALYELPFPDLIFHAQRIHRMHFDPREVQISTLLSIKTGGCPEDCAYCPQSARYDTGVKAERLMEVEAVLAEARRGQGSRREPLLHGRGVALTQGPRSRRGLRHDRRRKGARPRELRDAGHARRGAGAQAQVGGARLLQPQPRHLAGVLRRHHLDPHLSRPARHPRPCARRRHPCVLRRHRRDGRGARRPRRHDRDAREPAGAPGIGADQHAGPRGGHAAGDAAGRGWRSTPWSSSAPSPSPGSRCRPRWCGFRRAGRR